MADVGDHLATIRAAVADSQDRSGMSSLAARTRAGEMDRAPIMEAACAAVAAVLKEMFE